jgi:hypothetical protein
MPKFYSLFSAIMFAFGVLFAALDQYPRSTVMLLSAIVLQLYAME